MTTTPTRLGPYRVLGRLGRGGMAEVLLAEVFGASGFAQKVALKVLLPELRGAAELEKLLIEEAKLGGRLSHVNLVGVHDLGVEDGVYYVRMELVDGADLASLARGEPLELSLALLITEALALGLAYVHTRTDPRGSPLGLVHRDVSPHNVLVSREGEVKLGDFGIAKATQLAETTQANLRRGKYAYMSPEQVARAPLSAASDQFALGVVLYELIRGVRPYVADSPLVVLDMIREAAPPDLRGIDEDVGELILRCLARAPADRFSSTEALARALFVLRRLRAPASTLDLADWVRGRLAQPPAAGGRRLETRPLTDV
jgi:eukaryotic-like serine/threonine-protein kinase